MKLGDLFKQYHVRGEWYEFDNETKNEVIKQMDIIKKETDEFHQQVEIVAEECYQRFKKQFKPIKIKIKSDFYRTIYKTVFDAYRKMGGTKELIKWIYEDFEKRKEYFRSIAIAEMLEIE